MSKASDDLAGRKSGGIKREPQFFIESCVELPHVTQSVIYDASAIFLGWLWVASLIFLRKEAKLRHLTIEREAVVHFWEGHCMIIYRLSLNSRWYINEARTFTPANRKSLGARKQGSRNSRVIVC